MCIAAPYFIFHFNLFTDEMSGMFIVRVWGSCGLVILSEFAGVSEYLGVVWKSLRS